MLHLLQHHSARATANCHSSRPAWQNSGHPTQRSPACPLATAALMAPHCKPRCTTALHQNPPCLVHYGSKPSTTCGLCTHAAQTARKSQTARLARRQAEHVGLAAESSSSVTPYSSRSTVGSRAKEKHVSYLAAMRYTGITPHSPRSTVVATPLHGRQLPWQPSPP